MEPPPDENLEEKKAEWALPDLLKKALLTGTTALFMTEEGLRTFLGDLRFPKEMVQFAVNQVAKTKEELFKVLTKEVRDFLESSTLTDQFKQLLATTSLEINTKVRFVTEDQKIKPKTESQIKISKTSSKKSRKDSKS